MPFSPLFWCFSAFFRSFCGVETPGRASVVCVWQEEKKKLPATEIEVSPHRDWGKRGAERGQTRLRGDSGLNRVWGVSAPRLGSARFAFGVKSVREGVVGGAGVMNRCL